MSVSRVLTMLVVSVVLAVPVRGQTTQTERAAASDILRQIGELQDRLQPTRLARGLAGRQDERRDQLFQRVEDLWLSGMQDLSDHIGRNPEVGFKEFAAVDTLTRILRANGFTVESGQAGLETAFVARWDSPGGTAGPALGIIVEYDALRSTHEPFHAGRGGAPRAHRAATGRAPSRPGPPWPRS